MSVVRINAITVPAERAEECERRFAARAGEVGTMDGFEAFELLRLSDDRAAYLVYTRWASQEAFDAWVNGQAFQRGHKPHNPEGPVSSESALWSFDVIQREESSAPGA
jgi:heme-degrading monooxygenase HmoA